jgi:LacI family transcriptional regulator
LKEISLNRISDNLQMALAARSDAEAEHPVEVSLVSEVEAGVAPAKGVSVREVAKLAQVSASTVSLVLNSNPRISPMTQQRVRQAMEQLGYRPNRPLPSTSRKATQMIAVMLPSLSHAFADRYFGELISGICDRAAAIDYKVMLEQATPQFIKNRKHIELFDRRLIDGVLCLGNSDRHPFLTDFAAAGYPMIVVNNYFPQWDLDHVVCDYTAGAEQAMDYLFQLRHRKIGMIKGSTQVKTARDVVDAYERKLRTHGIEPLPSWREDGLFTEEGGAAAAQQLMTNNPDITAILVGNDKMALGAMHYLSTVGKKVPHDVSVIGIDDIQQAAFTNPALTTVRMPLYEAGVMSCEKLLSRIQGNKDPVRMVLPTHLVVRNSTGISRDTYESMQ